MARALQHPEGNDAPVTMELCDIIRRGGHVEVMEALKDPLKHQPQPIQLKALGTVNACVLGSGPEFAIYLSGEEWMERFFRIAKTTESDAVRDNIMLLILQWSRRSQTAGFRRAISRFSNSKTLGGPFAAIQGRLESESRAQDRVRGQSSVPRQSYQQPTSHRQTETQSRQVVLTKLEAFLMEAQTDLANLEYSLEHPGMGDDGSAVEDCRKHVRRAQHALESSTDLPEEAVTTLLQLTEQLNNALEIHAVISGSVDTAPPEARPSSRHQSAAMIGDSDDENAAANDSADEEPAVPQPRRNVSSIHAQRELAQMQVEAQTIKLLDDERKESAKLREELEQKISELEEQHRKYKEAKQKNAKAVETVREYCDKLEAAEAEIADLKAGKAKAEEQAGRPAPEPKIVEVVKKVVERPTVDREVIRKYQTSISTIRRSFRGLKDDVNQLRKELDVFVSRASSSVNHIVSAAESERAGDQKALQWIQDLYKKEQRLRKQYYNTIQELKGNIRVYCRIRPMSEKELSNGHESIVSFPADDEVALVDEKGKTKRYEFDAVFAPERTQAEVFTDTAPLIDSVVDGYNVCIFAYGQTGSGKTHTMNGYDDKGINRRALDRLFTVIDERTDTETSTVHVSVLEVYCEQIRDLLVSKAECAAHQYEVRTNGPYGNYVTNLSEVEVTSASEIDDVLAKAQSHRSEGKTDMNSHSSRSHMLLYILVRTTNNQTGVKTFGKLSLVDLAGSERLEKSGSEGQAAKEAVAINKSLSALGDVIAGLSSSAKHVPFRNSQLTFLLQDSMQGQAKVLMFCCASPASYNCSETISSLQFATRARGVSLGPIKKNAAH